MNRSALADSAITREDIVKAREKLKEFMSGPMITGIYISPIDFENAEFFIETAPIYRKASIPMGKAIFMYSDNSIGIVKIDKDRR